MSNRQDDRSWDEMRLDLSRLRVRRKRLQKSLSEVFASQNAIFRAARKMGTSIAEIARVSESNEQHVRNVIQGKNTYAAKNQKGPG